MIVMANLGGGDVNGSRCIPAETTIDFGAARTVQGEAFSWLVTALLSSIRLTSCTKANDA